MEKESMTIGSLHKSRPGDYYSVRNYGGARDAVVFSKQDSRKKIKVAIRKVAKGRKLR
jgi:type IV secretory pathway ATPase VirB11/archaellum biosynthesis ATPase